MAENIVCTKCNTLIKDKVYILSVRPYCADCYVKVRGKYDFTLEVYDKLRPKKELIFDGNFDDSITEENMKDYYKEHLQDKNTIDTNFSDKTISDYPQAISDCLYNLSPATKISIDYCRGIINGLISALLYKGYTYKECCGVIYMNLPSGYRKECLPEELIKFIGE
jgi:hypothetical protein